jgi:hopanoid biosynthesis associated protein HpnK
VGSGWDQTRDTAALEICAAKWLARAESVHNSFAARMSQSAPHRRLIVNADDFGRSKSINEAVIRAHTNGILTTTSLMVNEPDADDAVRFAKEHPTLGVGLHLALVCGRAAMPPEKIPNLADSNGQFSENAVAAGMKYFFSSKCREELRAEIEAQFERFQATGLRLDHVNGHLNMHLHPVVLGILLTNAERWGIRAMRLTDDNFFLNARIASGQWRYRASHAIIYRLLSSWARPRMVAKNIRHTNVVFGLLQNARVDRSYVEKLVPRLPPGDSELYSHPSLDQFKNEYDALVDPAVRRLMEEQGIRLIRYQDL